MWVGGCLPVSQTVCLYVCVCARACVYVRACVHVYVYVVCGSMCMWCVVVGRGRGVDSVGAH
jgi:hypothetical protein